MISLFFSFGNLEGMSKLVVYSVGIEQMKVQDLLGLLNRFKIRTIIDIRVSPVSKDKNFNKKLLAKFLTKHSFRYTWMKKFPDCELKNAVYLALSGYDCPLLCKFKIFRKKIPETLFFSQ